ncbi:hypothetical protein [Cohnella abietis]|uniref:hypothetical protein n=1 Tax=Cohnella abietis TaxID=2507935 RepID=UPI00102E2474|nr:hypothetical protein [Cohnella abietis]
MRLDWCLLYDYFEQRGLNEARLVRFVRIFRETRSGCGTVGACCTIISNNRFWMWHDWLGLFEYFEQQGLNEAWLVPVVRLFRTTRSG